MTQVDRRLSLDRQHGCIDTGFAGHCLVLHILDEGAVGMGEELRFFWNATRGNRLRPWRSPYLRWRLETFTGQRADTVRARDFWNLFWREKRQFFRFLRWTREMKSYSDSGERS